MTDVKSQWGPMGRVHKGFWNAMGEPNKKRTQVTEEIRKDTNKPVSNSGILRIELINTSVYRTIVSAIQGLGKIIQFVTFNLFHHVKEPVDSSWMGPDTDIRSNSMYALAEEHILHLIKRDHDATQSSRRRSGLSHGSTTAPSNKKKRLFITGHSLGGALSTSNNAIFICFVKTNLDYK